MSSPFSRPRVPAGVRPGGQFATGARDEAAVALDDPVGTDPEEIEEDDYADALASLRARLDAPTPTTASRARRLPDAPPGFPHDMEPPLTVSGANLPPMVFHHADAFDVAKVESITNTNFAKPDGGLWLSPIRDGGRSAWQQYLAWAKFDRAQSKDATNQSVRLRPEARVVVIDTREDLFRLAAAHPGPPAPDGMRGTPVDFEMAARTYDAIWLTRAGQNANHRHVDSIDLFSWDLESVLVLNPDAVDTDERSDADPHTRSA